MATMLTPVATTIVALLAEIAERSVARRRPLVLRWLERPTQLVADRVPCRPNLRPVDRALDRRAQQADRSAARRQPLVLRWLERLTRLVADRVPCRPNLRSVDRALDRRAQ